MAITAIRRYYCIHSQPRQAVFSGSRGRSTEIQSQQKVEHPHVLMKLKKKKKRGCGAVVQRRYPLLFLLLVLLNASLTLWRLTTLRIARRMVPHVGIFLPMARAKWQRRVAHVGAYCFLEGMGFHYASHNIRRFAPPCATIFVLPLGRRIHRQFWAIAISPVIWQCLQTLKVSRPEGASATTGRIGRTRATFHLERCEDQIHVFRVTGLRNV